VAKRPLLITSRLPAIASTQPTTSPKSSCNFGPAEVTGCWPDPLPWETGQWLGHENWSRSRDCKLRDWFLNEPSATWNLEPAAVEPLPEGRRVRDNVAKIARTGS
jgi:hypothetical protein